MFLDDVRLVAVDVVFGDAVERVRRLIEVAAGDGHGMLVITLDDALRHCTHATTAAMALLNHAHTHTHTHTRLTALRPGTRNNARCTKARKATHGLDGQHQDVDRTLRGRVNQNDRGQR